MKLWLWQFSWYRNNRQQHFVSSGKRRYTNADIIIIIIYYHPFSLHFPNESTMIWSQRITDVANSKHHQQLDEILIIFTHTIQEICKVVCKKTMSETCAFLTSLCCMNVRITASICKGNALYTKNVVTHWVCHCPGVIVPFLKIQTENRVSLTKFRLTEALGFYWKSEWEVNFFFKKVWKAWVNFFRKVWNSDHLYRVRA